MQASGLISLAGMVAMARLGSDGLPRLGGRPRCAGRPFNLAGLVSLRFCILEISC